MSALNPKVDFYFKKEKRWQQEIDQMRMIVLDKMPKGFELKEELKWGSPCYTFEDSNVVLIHVFKEYCAYLFFKGALLKDKYGKLIQQTKNVQAARQMRFTDIREILDSETVIIKYIREAIELEKAGVKVELKKTTEYEIPEEFKNKLNEFPALKSAFEALTPGRQRGYLLHFSQPKQTKTRESRIEKCIPEILNGKGLNE